MKRVQIFISIVILLLGSCQIHNKTSRAVINKIGGNDKFKSTIVTSEFFQIDAAEDNIVESIKGTLIHIPKGAFKDDAGNKITNRIQIEFAEASDIDEIILSNLVMQDSGFAIQTHKSFFINATYNGEQLRIDPSNPVYIEIASEKSLKLFHGSRSEEGNMTWGNSVEPVKYLLPVSLDMLNFYPPGFECEVEKGIPYKDYKISTKKLVDSLYYSLSTDNNEGQSSLSQIYCINMLAPLQILTSGRLALLKKIQCDTSISCGINPVLIKVIKTRKFQNTLISTREFETRLKSIFKTCDNSILELYVNNLNKNMWEIDSLAAEKLGKNHNMYQTFVNYASLKQTTVEVSDKKAEFLSKYFYEQVSKIEAELDQIKNEFLKIQIKNEEIVQQKANKYRELLQERQKYRMNKFGFELTETGWFNAAEKIHLADLKKFELNTKIINGDKFDQVYAYVVNPKIRSIFSLLADDKVNFSSAFQDDPDLLLWENQKFNIIGVGYKNKDISYTISEADQKPVTQATLNLESGTIKQFKQDLKQFTKDYKDENKILVDLEYQAFFYEEKEKAKKLKEEETYINKLRNNAFPCCDSIQVVRAYPAQSK